VSKLTGWNPTVLETLQTYSAAENPVNHRVPQDFQMISTSGKVRGREQESSTSAAKAAFLGELTRRGLKPRPFKAYSFESAQQYGLPVGVNANFGVRFCDTRFAQPETEDKKLRKDPSWRFLALKVPFGNSLLSE
jgi:hypothetical protein